MNADPLLQPLRLGRHTFPGIWRVMMPKELLQLRFPDERGADCMNCPKSCYDAWRPDYRCCTYHPRISNFLLGLACRTGPGASAVDELLKRGMVLPEGMHSSPRQWLDFVDDEHHDRYGKSQKVLCPLLDTVSGHCRVHAFRNSVCSTYFCTKDHGHRGGVFWSQIQTLGTQLEMRLAQWALREAGFDVERSHEVMNELGPELLRASSEQGWHPEALKKIWGAAWGHEKELLLACAAIIHKHQDSLWAIAQGEVILEPHRFDEALWEAVPKEQKEILDEDEESWDEDVDLAALWNDCLEAHAAVWENPEGLFTLNPNVSFVPNLGHTLEERYHGGKDFFIEYRFPNPERSLYFRLAVTTAQKVLLENFHKAQALESNEPAAQDFLREMLHRQVLRRA